MSDTKPRRWEILEGATKTIVVEASAYDALEAELAALKKQLEEYDDAYVKLELISLNIEGELGLLQNQIDDATFKKGCNV